MDDAGERPPAFGILMLSGVAEASPACPFQLDVFDRNVIECHRMSAQKIRRGEITAYPRLERSAARYHPVAGRTRRQKVGVLRHPLPNRQ